MPTRKRLPAKRRGVRFTLNIGAHPATIHTGEYEDGTLGEIFINVAKLGTFTSEICNAFAMMMSLALQHGVPLKTLHHTFRNFNMEPDLIRGIFEELEIHYGEETP